MPYTYHATRRSRLQQSIYRSICFIQEAVYLSNQLHRYTPEEVRQYKQALWASVTLGDIFELGNMRYRDLENHVSILEDKVKENSLSAKPFN